MNRLHRASARRLVALGLAAFGLAGSSLACESDPPIPSGRLSSPTGLAYVRREGSRRDLYIADSDAEGVRILQAETSTDVEGKLQLRRAFVPAPAVYFPLLIPTPGFPTRIAASSDGLRIYVLAPTSRSVYVIDGTPLPLLAPPTSDGAQVLLDIVLESLTAPTWTPSALAVVPGDVPGRDLVLVGFDVLGEPDGQLLGVSVEATASGPRLLAGTAVTRPIAPGPRSLVVRGDVLVASSAGSSSLSVVPLSGGVLGQVRRVDVGGTTSLVVDGEDLGLLAFRLDAARVSVLDESSGALDYAGSVATRSSPVAGGAYGRLPALSPYRGTSSADQSAAPDVLADLPRGVGGVSLVAVVHADAEMSFLIPAPGATPPVRVAEDRPASVTRLTSLVGDVSIAECPGSTQVCSAADATPPTCNAGVVTRTSTGAVPLDLRATFQGPLARWRRLADTDAAPIRLVSATSSAATIRIDGGDFAERQIGPGDVVELALETPLSCAMPQTVFDVQDSGVVVGVEEAALVVEVPLTGTATLGQRLADLVACPESVLWFAYEVHPAGREVVVASVVGANVGVIHRRIPFVDSSTAAVRLELEPSSPLRLNATLLGNLACTTESRSPGTASCYGDVDCGGAVCTRTGLCEGSCVAAQVCDEGVRGCLTRENVRRCSAVELSIAPPIPLEYNLSLGSDFVTSAPDEVVFDPARPGFFVSFPGGREIVDAHATTDNRQLVIDRVR